MNTNYLENNHLVLVGKITSEKKFSHEVYGETFYTFSLEVPRLSDITDVIPVTVSERLIIDMPIEIGKEIIVEGQFRSYNTYEDNRSRLVLTVFAKEIIERVVTGEADDKISVSNEVTLTGFLCKPAVYRKTPFGREIADILLAVNRAYNKSDYIPCIAWGRNARFCNNLPVGSGVKIVGRIQSRNYIKTLEDGTQLHKTAYEVSIGSMQLVKEDGKTEEIPVEGKEDDNTDNVDATAVENNVETTVENSENSGNQEATM